MSRTRQAVARACRRLVLVAAVAPLACRAATPPPRAAELSAATPEGLAAAESRRLRTALERALEEPSARAIAIGVSDLPRTVSRFNELAIAAEASPGRPMAPALR